MKQEVINLSLSLSAILMLTSTSTAMATSKMTTIDTLVIYNQGAVDVSNGDIETRINHLFTTTNKIYQDSGLNIELKAVKTHKLNLSETEDSEKLLKATRNNSEVKNLRDTVGADEVVIYRKGINDGRCGVAFINKWNNASYAYAHVSINCASYLTAHEVGHNMGLDHSKKQDRYSSYARGYGIENQFTTIMAYDSVFHAHKIYKFSDPDLDCNGEPCGISKGLINEADAVRAIELSAPKIKNYRKHIEIKESVEQENKEENKEEIEKEKEDQNNEDEVEQNNQLENAKKAYEAQHLLVNKANIEFTSYRKEIRSKVSEIRKIYRDKRKEARKLYFESRAEAFQATKNKRRILVQTYRDAKVDYSANKITKEALTQIVKNVHAQSITYSREYKELSVNIRETYKKTLIDAKNEIKSMIVEIRDNFEASRDSYKEETRKFLKLKEAYETLLRSRK